MRSKRTHRILCEALESRRLLSSNFHYIAEMDSAGPPPITAGQQVSVTSGSTVCAYTDIPFHVTGVQFGSGGGDDDGVAFGGSYGTDDVIESEWQWNFGDPGSEYNQLNGFNAAHIYTNAGTYTITLTVTNQSGTPTPFTLNVVVTRKYKGVGSL